MTEDTELLREIRDLLLVMAEPGLAKRDERLRDVLIRIVGKSAPKAKAALLMNGAHNQAAIRAQTGINQGNLSTLVKELGKSKLLAGDQKQPRLAISIPSDFFERAMER